MLENYTLHQTGTNLSTIEIILNEIICFHDNKVLVKKKMFKKFV